MSEVHQSVSRGRPKVLDRDQVLHTALMSYWADGPTVVAINEICRRAGVSKPSLYREFGNDDGLKLEVLGVYERMVLIPFFEVLERDQPFDQSLESLINFTIQDRKALGIPVGCLFVEMRSHYVELGENTCKRIDQLRDESLDKYEKWIDRAKSNGEFNSGIPTATAALYFDAQNGSAMRMQKEGVANKMIAEFLSLAFSKFGF